MTYEEMIAKIGNGVRPISVARSLFGKAKPSWAIDLRDYCWNKLTAERYHDEMYQVIAERIYIGMPLEVKAIADTLTYS